MKVLPAKHSVSWHQDAYGNFVARLLFPEKTEEFAVEVNLVAELSPLNPFDFFVEPEAENYPFEYSLALAKNLQSYRTLESAGPLLQSFLAILPRASTSTVGFLVNLNQKVREQVQYLVRLESGIQSCEETLQRGTGSCRDSTWFLVQVLRHLGFASRFVSGYLIQLASEQDPLDPSKPATKDSVDLHAWAEVYLPGAGWIGFDPTSGLLTSEGHIALAYAPDPSEAAAMAGTVEPSQVEFSYEMSLHRLRETPSITTPYTDEQWQNVERLAKQVDGELQGEDVRLTMGGEPTFVGLDEPESPQWNGVPWVLLSGIAP